MRSVAVGCAFAMLTGATTTFAVAAHASPPEGSQPTVLSQTVTVGPALVTTLAGSGSSSVTDGTGVGASFQSPIGLHAVGGFAYTFDGAHLRKVNLASGQVSKVAGSGSYSAGDNTDPLAASIAGGSAAMADDGMYLYFLDNCVNFYGCVRRMSLATGAISTILRRSGQPAYSSLAVGPGGAVYVGAGSTIERVDTVNGTSTVVATLTSATAGQDMRVRSMTADSDALFVSATENNSQYNFQVASALLRVDPTTGTSQVVNGAAPQALIVSAGPYLYAAGTSYGARRYTKSDGSWVSIAGQQASTGQLNGTGSQAWFESLSGITTDGTDVFVADQYAYRIKRLASGTALPKTQPTVLSQTVTVGPAVVSTLAGSGAAAVVDGTATAASFLSPIGLHVVGGFGYTFDGGFLRKVDLASRQVSKVAGTGTFGTRDQTDPAAATVGGVGPMADDGTYLYFLDSCMNTAGCVRRMSFETGAVSTLLSRSSAPAYSSLAVGPGGALYVGAGSTIERVDTVNGTSTLVATLTSATAGQDLRVRSMTADSGALFVSATDNNTQYGTQMGSAILRVDPATGTSQVVNGAAPQALLASAGNYLYAAAAQEVRRYAKSDGSWVSVAGQPSSSGQLDGTGSQAWFETISGIATDGTNLFVADQYSYRISRLAGGSALTKTQPAALSATVVVGPALMSTLAGSGTSAVVDGTGTGASFLDPRGMHVIGGVGYTFDGAYLRKVNLATGQVSKVAGTGSYGVADNTNPHAAYVAGLGTMADDGTYLYFADACNGYACLRRMSLLTEAVSTMLKGGYGSEFKGVAVGPAGALFVAADNIVYRVDTVNNTLSVVATLTSETAGQDMRVRSMTADSTALFMSATENNTQYGFQVASAILRVAPTTGTVSTLTQQNVGSTRPTGVIVSAGNYLYGTVRIRGA